MTRDEIIKMAEKCGIPEFENNESQAEQILSFAALVAAAEREACLQIADHCADADMHASVAANAIRARSNT
jgi:hypothetical protein